MPTIPKTPRQSLPKVTLFSCMPQQYYENREKLIWLDCALRDLNRNPNSSGILFLTPQEYIGGHYTSKMMLDPQLHVHKDSLSYDISNLCRKHKVHLGVGACVYDNNTGPMECYLYFDDEGKYLGEHRKIALPSYDDVRTKGHGGLWPETNFQKRVVPIEIPKLRLRVGTIFCWEAFSQTLWPTYSLAGVNLIVHPIKFAPRAWLKNKILEDGKKHIVGFGNNPESEIWIDRLRFASRHQVMCPIAISCNSWGLGKDFKAVVGFIDELPHPTLPRGVIAEKLRNVPSIQDKEEVVAYEVLPEYYSGIDHLRNPGSFVEHVGDITGYEKMSEWMMHSKIRRIESQCIGGSTLVSCKTAVQNRQKKRSLNRALSIPSVTPKTRKK